MYKLEILDDYHEVTESYEYPSLDDAFAGIKELAKEYALDQFKLYKPIDLEFDVVVNIA